MAILSIEDFKKLGGEPSNKWGSNYSSMCKLITEMHDLRDYMQNYAPKAYQDKCITLNGLVQRFHPNDVGSTNDKKNKEIAAARALKESLKDLYEQVRVWQLLDKMAKHSKPLVSNTGKNVILKLKARAFGISVTQAAGTNASFSANTLAINVANFWKSEKLAIGVLVHEYHHYLSRGDGPDLYTDEFVAHWKQYLAMDLGKDKFDNLNHWLLDDATGYQMRNTHLNRRTPFTKPEDAGTIWTKYLDNVKVG